MQVVAGPWRDDVALAVAQVLERELGGWQPPSSIDLAGMNEQVTDELTPASE